MKRRGLRVTLTAGALGLAVVAAVVAFNWGVTRDHVEAWWFQLTMEREMVARLTKTHNDAVGKLDRSLSARALVESGSVRALLILLKNQDWVGSHIFANACKDYGDERVVMALAKLLRTHEDALVRHHAAVIMSAMGSRSRPGLAALRHALGDLDSDVRVWAISAIGEIGHEAKAATPDLVRILVGDPEDQARSGAAHALSDVGADDPLAISALKETITHNNRPLRYAAALSLQKLGFNIKITAESICLLE